MSEHLRKALERTGLGETLCRDAASAARTLTPELVACAPPELLVTAMHRATPSAKVAVWRFLNDHLPEELKR